LKEEIIPDEVKGKFQNWMFGCDICQDVCPWNSFSRPHQETDFTPITEVLNFTTRDWEALSEQAFKKLFKQSPLSRAKLKGIHRNIKFIQV
jgi:epoxyqueuosine reductase